MTWRDRPVLVTGCTGLIGAWLTRELVAQGARVMGLVRDTVPRTTFTEWNLGAQIVVVRGDLSDYPLLERTLAEYEIDTVFHLAALAAIPVANRTPLATFETNIRGTYHVLEACRRTSTIQRVVVASSDKAYGEQPNLPYSETDSLHGDYPYDVSKSCVDLLAQSYWKTYRLPVCITRCANMFGAGDLQWTRIVPRTIRLALKDEAPTIRSDGAYQRDYCYVKNIADAYLTLAQQMREVGCEGEAFNFGSETPRTVLALVDTILGLMGKRHLLPSIHNTATGEIKEQWLSCAKAKRVLGWQAQIGLEAGLRETIDWYTRYLNLEIAWDIPLSAS
jgi:CDP-glucose 4,6-dehydratase